MRLLQFSKRGRLTGHLYLSRVFGVGAQLTFDSGGFTFESTLGPLDIMFGLETRYVGKEPDRAFIGSKSVYENDL